MSKEAFFISQFSSRAIGDDGAIVGREVYSKDLFCEGIHFKREWMSLYHIARKSMLVNLSDAIAMNAIPKRAMIGIVIPKQFRFEELQELASGFESIANEYGVEIIGGDTTAGKSLMISISIIATLNGKPLMRKNAKVGNFVAYTGTLGASYKELTRLLRGGKVTSKSRFVTPVLKKEFIFKASKYLSAGMDVSDGLSKDLSRITAMHKGMSFSPFSKLPKRLVCSGEEYEMLITFEARHKAHIERIAKQTRTPLTVIGRLKRGRYRCICKEHHF